VAKRRVGYIAKLLDEIGLGGKRIQMYNLSSAMGGRFAQIASEMTETVKETGPNPLKREVGEQGRA
jgi:coenzyme F420-reducing hydrogenase delta subunit